MKNPLEQILLEGDTDALCERRAGPDWKETELLPAIDSSAEALRSRLGGEGVPGDQCGQVALHDALVMSGAVKAWETVDTLIERGADINGRDRWGQTVMHLAVTDSLESVQEVLKRGGHAATYDWQFVSTPVGWAGFFGHGDRRDYLLDHADLHPVDAAVYDRVEKLDALLAKDPAAIDGVPYESAGWIREPDYPVVQGLRLGDPLRACAQYGNFEAMKRLLGRGARADLPDVRTGIFEYPWLTMSALGWASKNEDPKPAALLRDAGAEWRITDAAAVGNLAKVRFDQGADEALFLAVNRGHLQTAKTLVEAGAKVNCVARFDQQLRTPLCAAVQHGLELVETLLEAGADPGIESLDGKVAADYTDNEAIRNRLARG